MLESVCDSEIRGRNSKHFDPIIITNRTEVSINTPGLFIMYLSFL